MKRFIVTFLTTLTIFGAAFTVRADDTAPTADTSGMTPAMDASSPDSFKPAMDENAWQFGLSIPLWAPQIDGTATVRGRQKNLNISYNTLRQHLDAVFALEVEARKGKFDFYGDVGYMKFSAGGFTLSSGLKFLFADAGVGYVLVKTESEHPFLLEATAGARYWYASTWLSSAPLAFRAAKTWNVVDPVLGFRGSQYFTRKLHLDFQADGGGFNLSHNTDWTWMASVELSYDFVKWFTLSAGYQALALDESEGGGADKNGINVIFNGVLIEAAFKF
jgi:hypothetical protein